MIDPVRFVTTVHRDGRLRIPTAVVEELQADHEITPGDWVDMHVSVREAATTHECVTCGEAFGTYKGLRIHQGKLDHGPNPTVDELVGPEVFE